MIILSSANTNVGMVRTENQDAFGCSPENNLFFVCDGMGGGVAGDFASRYAVDIILESYSRIKKEEVYEICGQNFLNFSEEIVRPIAAIKLANRALHNLTVKYPKLAGMGTTCTMVWFERETSLLHIYNVGDSRVYRTRNGVIKLLTEDHSKIKELIDSGKMTEADVKTAEIQSMITRALGIAPTVRVDYHAETVKNGDLYVLCSDGLNGELADATINDLVNLYKPDVSVISNELIMAANNAGGKDNTTVIALCAQDEDGFNPGASAAVQETILISENENSRESSVEDGIIRKISKFAATPIPKLATKKNIFKNPFVLAALIVLLCISGIVLYSVMSQKEEKSIEYLTGNISGMMLDIRTPVREKLDELRQAEDKISKMQILQECIANKDTMMEPMPNVEILIENNIQTQFIGISSTEQLEVKLPKGRYIISLTYPSYKILDERFELTKSENIYLEGSGTLNYKMFVMLPENI